MVFIMQNKNIIFILLISLSFWDDGGGASFVNAVASGGRRRRRSLYNERPCGPGQMAIWTPSKKKVDSCVSCEEGKYRSDSSHALEKCNICEGGRYSSQDFSYCIGDICKAGSFGVAGKSDCALCPTGKYSHVDGLFICKECESGRFSISTGSLDCMGDMCPAGKWGASGASSGSVSRACYTCRAGHFSHAGSSMCITCPKGKYSAENAGVCIEHDKCSRNSYPDVEPTAVSAKVSCARCIYSSDIVFIGFVFAVIVASINILLFLYDRSKYCHALFFVISPALWALFMNMCRSKPGNVGAIISVAMNLMCTLPAYSALKYKCIDILEKRCNETNEKKKIIYAMSQRKRSVKNNLETVSIAV